MYVTMDAIHMHKGVPSVVLAMLAMYVSNVNVSIATVQCTVSE